MKVGRLEIHLYPGTSNVTLVKHYNDDMRKQIDLDEDDIYSLEFIIKEIKRKLELK